MPREQLQQLQLQRLLTKVQQVYERVPFYRKAFKERGITPVDIKSLRDLTRLPFTSKLDFKSNYPLGLMAVPMEQIVRIHSSSGTTDKPTIAPYTRGDINTWSEILARGLATAGVVAGTSFRTPSATGFSPAAWGTTTGSSAWGLP